MALSNRYIYLFVIFLTTTFGYSQVWRPIGPVPGPRFINIHAITTYQGNIIVGGDFTKPIYDFERVARWNGTQWLDMANGIENQFLTIDGNAVNMLESYHDSLFAGGCFWNFSRLAYLVRWDNIDWRHFHDSSGTGGCVYTSYIYGDSMFLGGASAFGWGKDPNNRTGMIGLWHQGKMHMMGRGMHSSGQPFKGVKAITADDSSVYAGGSFYLFNDSREHHLVRWDGKNWTPMADSINGEVTHLVSYKGSLYVSGRFTKINNDSIAWLARWDGQAWHDVPEIEIRGHLLCSKVYHDVLYLGGHFVGNIEADRDSISCLLGFDGEKWFSPAIVNADIGDMEIMDDELVMGGGFTKIDTLQVNFLAGLKTIAATNTSEISSRKLQIFPNPGSQIIHINFSIYPLSESDIGIFDLYGRKVSCFISERDQKLSIDISSLTPGIYQLQINTKSQVFSSTFLKI